MNVISKIQLYLRKPLEVSSDEYLSTHIKPEDAKSLANFVDSFTDEYVGGLAILAVGSSTFPLSHWVERKKLNHKFPNANAAEAYRDIDLILAPQIAKPRDEFIGEITAVLKKSGYESKVKENTLAGVLYCKGSSCDNEGNWRKEILPWQDIDYGLHSIQTQLANGTDLDIIIGRGDLIETTAAEKIAEERKYKNAFCLLHE